MLEGVEEALEVHRRLNDRLRRSLGRCCNFIVSFRKRSQVVDGLFNIPSRGVFGMLLAGTSTWMGVESRD